MNVKVAFKPFRAAARRLMGNRLRVIAVLAATAHKAARNPQHFQEVWEEFTTLIAMIGAWAKRDYKEVPSRSVLLGLGATLYFLSPIDLIPDFLPGGFVDDLAVLTLVLGSLRSDIAAFRIWRGSV